MPQREARTIYDLVDRPEVRTPDGPATLNSIGIGTDRGEVLIPQVRRGLDRLMTPDEAFQHYLATGEHLGIFDTPDESTAEGARLSREQAGIGRAKAQMAAAHVRMGPMAGLLMSLFGAPGGIRTPE